MIKVILKVILIFQKLSRPLLGPDMGEEAWCRLCLTKRNVPPLLDLSQNAYLASLITKVLCLRVSLSCNTSKPCHVCHACHDTIQTFVTLRDLALKNEEIFIKSNESQKSILNKEEIRNQVQVESRKTGRILACGNCFSCKKEDCGICANCQDMKKFGGSGKLRKKCRLRACSAQIQSKNLQMINKVVLSCTSLNNNLPAKTCLSTTSVPKSPQFQDQEDMSSSEAKEDVSLFHDVQEDVSSSHDVQRDLSTSPKVQGDVSSSPEVHGDVSSSPKVQGNVSSSPEVWGDVSSSHMVQGNVSTSSEPSRHVSALKDHDYESQIPEVLGQEGGVTAENSQAHHLSDHDYVCRVPGQVSQLPGAEQPGDSATCCITNTSCLEFSPVTTAVSFSSPGLPVIEATKNELSNKGADVTVSGSVQCLRDCPVITITLKPVGFGKDIKIPIKDGMFVFENQLPGSYIALVSGEGLCFETDSIPFKIESDPVNNLHFKQTGWAMEVHSSHETVLKFSDTGTSQGDLDIPIGHSVHCMPTPGPYKLTASSCHIFHQVRCRAPIGQCS